MINMSEEDFDYTDRRGKPIKVGSKVVWYDPEKSARNLKNVWTVWEMVGDIVYISIDDENGHLAEAEVFPEELKVVG